jgi:DNA-binding transcriptional regulator GbsR (MarR family)
MDKKVREARKKAIEALASAVGFWGVDTLETRLFASLFLSPHPMNHAELVEELEADDEEINEKIKLLVRLGAIKMHKGKRPGCSYYEAESDFFEILQTVLKERREREMGRALTEISRQRKYVEERFDDEGDPELGFIAERLAKLDKAIKVIDKTMYGLGALASIRGMFKGK